MTVTTGRRRARREAARDPRAACRARSFTARGGLRGSGGRPLWNPRRRQDRGRGCATRRQRCEGDPPRPGSRSSSTCGRSVRPRPGLLAGSCARPRLRTSTGSSRSGSPRPSTSCRSHWPTVGNRVASPSSARSCQSSATTTGDICSCAAMSWLPDVPSLFDPRNPLLPLAPRKAALDELVELLADPEVAEIWLAPDTLGWAYQFFNTGDERRQMREAPAPRDSARARGSEPVLHSALRRGLPRPEHARPAADRG